MALTIITAATSFVLPDDPSITSAVCDDGRHLVIDLLRIDKFPVNNRTAFGRKIKNRDMSLCDELKRAEPLIIRTVTRLEYNSKSQRLQDALNNFLEDILGVIDESEIRDRDREDGVENDRRLLIIGQRERA